MPVPESQAESLNASFWRDRKVLVTGATGFVGGHLVQALVERGADVVALVRDEVRQCHLYESGLDRRVAIARGAVEDEVLVERVLAEYEVEAVFHLAAQTIVGIASQSPMSTWDTNVRGTWTVLEACRRNMRRVRRVVVASSDKAYGAQEVLPYEEGARLEGRFPYDCSKSCVDLIATSYHRTFGLPVAITRCANLYGAADRHWNRLVPGTFRSALRGERPVIRSDGRLVRDYLHISDGVAAYLSLAEAMEREAVVGEAFNFSSEVPLTVAEMARRVLSACGREDLELDLRGEVTFETSPSRVAAGHEIPAQTLSSEKAHTLLGWRAKMGLEAGLEATVGWYRGLLGRG
jgi:CDP-glucose 4,6-dehydratase